MTSYEFIKNQLELLVELFNQIKVRYEFDKEDSIHFIEVLPSKIYKSDFKYFEANLIAEFIESFPNESICFLSEDSLIEIENPTLEYAGIFYGADTENDFRITPASESNLNIKNISLYTPKNSNTIGYPLSTQTQTGDLGTQAMCMAA